jgi:hypothetical protein
MKIPFQRQNRQAITQFTTVLEVASKGAVLPLHHGVLGLVILDWRFSTKAQMQLRE